MSVSDKIISRYSERFKEFGCDVKTLGWGSEEQQIRRFHEFTKHIPDIHNKSIIDIGCGLGDYYNFLGKGGCLNYLGIDINPDLIGAANSNFKDNYSVNFSCKDLLHESSESPRSKRRCYGWSVKLKLQGRNRQLRVQQNFNKKCIYLCK